MTDEPDVVLTLRPVADPLIEQGAPPRDPDYRLKLALKVLLRSFGLKVVSVADAKSASEQVTPNGL